MFKAPKTTSTKPYVPSTENFKLPNNQKHHNTENTSPQTLCTKQPKTPHTKTSHLYLFIILPHICYLLSLKKCFFNLLILLIAII